MKPVDDLFRIIKTLSPPEKRYFKLFAARNIMQGKNNYLLLFDAMDNREFYDEEALKGQFAGQTFTRYFPSTKFELLNLLLRSLNAFYNASTDQSEFLEVLNFAEILKRKNLYDLAARQLKKAEKLASSREDFPGLIHSLKNQLSLISHLPREKREKETNRIGKLLSELHRSSEEDLYAAIVLLSLNDQLVAQSSEWSDPEPAPARKIYLDFHAKFPGPYSSARTIYRNFMMRAAVSWLEKDYHRCLSNLSNSVQTREESKFVSDENEFARLLFYTGLLSGLAGHKGELKFIIEKLGRSQFSGGSGDYLEFLFSGISQPFAGPVSDVVPGLTANYHTRRYWISLASGDFSTAASMRKHIFVREFTGKFDLKRLVLLVSDLCLEYSLNIRLRGAFRALAKYSVRHKDIPECAFILGMLENIQHHKPVMERVEEEIREFVLSKNNISALGYFDIFSWLKKFTGNEPDEECAGKTWTAFSKALLADHPFRLIY